MSDIDILPICSVDVADDVARQQARLVDWWAASGRAQTLDVGWLAFTPDEVERAVRSGTAGAAERMRNRRWFHGLDKTYGGYGASDPHGYADAFATWATAVRFDAVVIEARVAEWRRHAREAQGRAHQARQAGDRISATLEVRDAARALRVMLIESWGERLGSMGREWTRFERIATQRGATSIAERIAFVADAEPAQLRDTMVQTPFWLQERVQRAYAARLDVGEEVTAEESARDQISAFRVLVPRHRPDLRGDWLGLPDPNLDQQLAELDRLVSGIG